MRKLNTFGVIILVALVVGGREFPEGEVGWVALFWVNLHAGTRLLLLEVEFGKISVLWELGSVVVNAVASRVGVALFFLILGSFRSVLGCGR